MEEQSVYDNLEPKIHHRIAEAVADAIPVLDIACGEGRLTGFIASAFGSKTYGVDISISHLGGCPRIASLPRKELKIFSDILMSKT